MKDDAGGCGFYWSAKYIESRQAMSGWIEDVLLQIDMWNLISTESVGKYSNIHSPIFN